MDRGRHALRRVVEEQRYAVGSGHPDADTALASDQRIAGFHRGGARFGGATEKVAADGEHACAVGLMREQQSFFGDAQFGRQRLSALRHVGRMVSAVGGDVESGVRAFSTSSTVAQGRKGTHAVA